MSQQDIRLEATLRALKVIALDPRIRAFLTVYDPYALTQAEVAINTAVYRYGCTNRPPGYAQVPKGDVGTAPNSEYNHGEVHYGRPLTDQEIYDFELTDLNWEPPKEGEIYQHENGDRFIVRSADHRRVFLSDLEYYREDPDWCGKNAVTPAMFRTMTKVNEEA